MENSFKFIKSTFLQLTSKTYPYGTEDELVEEMTNKGIFPILEKDAWGNYFYKIGESRTIFTSHLDTACREQVEVKHNISKQQIVTTDGKSILGADDKAGVTILLWLIKNNIPGLYYFFIGEEVGCVGSSAASVRGFANFKGKYDRMISFDRRGTNSVITFQSSHRSCSDEFGKSLAGELNKFANLFYKTDDTGVYTDSAEFVDVIPECTNISVGYQSEHTHRESQDLYHLNKLALACLGVDWENLPTKRVAGSNESKWSRWGDYKSTSSRYSEPEYDDYSYGWGSSKRKNDYQINIGTTMDEDDYGYTSRGRKKTRRGNSKKEKFNFNTNSTPFSSRSRTFYDGGNGLVELPSNKGLFDVFRDKFLGSDMTREELELVKDQYLDMTDPYDRRSYDKLSKLL